MKMMPSTIATTTTTALQAPPPERGTCGKGEGIVMVVVVKSSEHGDGPRKCEA